MLIYLTDPLIFNVVIQVQKGCDYLVSIYNSIISSSVWTILLLVDIESLWILTNTSASPVWMETKQSRMLLFKCMAYQNFILSINILFSFISSPFNSGAFVNSYSSILPVVRTNIASCALYFLYNMQSILLFLFL